MSPNIKLWFALVSVTVYFVFSSIGERFGHQGLRGSLQDVTAKVVFHPSKWNTSTTTEDVTVVTVCQGDRCLENFDASDVLAQGCREDLLRRFHVLATAQESPMLVGVEFHCSNKNKCHKFTNRAQPSTLTHRPTERRYLNGGFVMGTAGATGRAWQEIAERYSDTQLGWGEYTDEHPELVAVDWDQEVVASNTAQEWQAHFNFVPDVGVVQGVAHSSGFQDSNASAQPVKVTTGGESWLLSRPVFLHVLCHTCGDTHPTGKGGPEAYRNISTLMSSLTEGGKDPLC